MQLEVNGKTYTGFKSCLAEKSIEAAAGTFCFTAVSASALTLPIAKGDACRVMVEGVPVITGYIEKLEGKYDCGSHTMAVSGRDRTCDFIDSALPDGLELAAGGTLRKVIKTIISEAGLTGVSVIDKVNDLKPFTTRDNISGEVGEKCFAFAERYCRKRQALLTCDGNGNFVLTRASTTPIKTMLLNKTGGKQNNIKAAVWEDDDSRRYASVTFKSQANFSVTQDTVMDYSCTASDSAIRTSRNMVLMSDSASDLATLKKSAVWHINMLRTHAKTYKCVVAGFTATADGVIWQPNMLVQVQDDCAAVHGEMLVKAVRYSLENGASSLTKLTLVTPDAFTLEAQMSARESAANDVMGDE
jgi:prophage tail gpP-like protein